VILDVVDRMAACLVLFRHGMVLLRTTILHLKFTVSKTVGLDLVH